MNKVLWILAPAAVLGFAAIVQSTGCATTAADCAALGLPAGCKPDSVTASSGTGTGGTGGTGGKGGAGGKTTSTSAGGSGGGGPAAPAICAHRLWGDDKDQAAHGLLVHPATQDVFLGGQFQGVLDLGVDPQTAGMSGSMFVGRLRPDLTGIWSKAFDATYMAMALDVAGNVFLAGTYTSMVGFGCGATTLDPTMGSFFLVKLDPTGNCVFSTSFPANVVRASLAVDAQGYAVLAAGALADATGHVRFDIPLPSQGGEDIVVVRFDAVGNASWSRLFGTANDDEAVGVAVSAAGDLTVAGTFNGKINFGDGMGAVDSKGHVGVFVASFHDPVDAGAGATAWSRSFSGDHDLSAVGLVTLAGTTAGLAVGGTYTGSLDVGEKLPLSNATSAFFLTRLGVDGSPLGKTISISGVAPTDIAAMAAGPADDVALAGSHGASIYVTRVDGTGVASTPDMVSGTSTHPRARGVAFIGDAAKSSLLVGGYFDQTLDVGASAPIASFGGDDVLLLKVCLP